jgi:hypothetical protein
MATQLFKTVFTFENQGAGWSETYYQNADGAPAAITGALALFGPRTTLLAKPSTLTFIRVSSLVNPKIHAIRKAPTFNYFGYISSSDIPGGTASIVCAAAAGSPQRRISVRGIPDNLFDISDPANPDAVNWAKNCTKLKGFFDSLVSQSWQILAVNRATPVLTVQDILPTATDDATTITTNLVHGFGVGDLVNIKKVKNFGRPIGIVRVVSVLGANSFQVAINAWQSFVYVPGATVQAYALAPATIAQVDFREIWTRDTGRPFGEHRGARPKRHR